MKYINKNIIITIILLIYCGCSNVERISVDNEKNIKLLNETADTIIMAAEKKEFAEIEPYIDNNIILGLKYQEFKKLMVHEYLIVKGMPYILDGKGYIPVGVTINDDTFYFEVICKLIENRWIVVDIIERG